MHISKNLFIKKISNIDSKKVDPSQEGNLNKFIDILSLGTDFDETLYIADRLMSISAGIPSVTEIVDNVEKEVIYEENEVDGF